MRTTGDTAISAYTNWTLKKTVILSLSKDDSTGFDKLSLTFLFGLLLMSNWYYIVGLEDPEYLIADLEQALGKM